MQSLARIFGGVMAAALSASLAPSGPASASGAALHTRTAPSSVVRSAMRRTVEVRSPITSFRRSGRPLSVPDGKGGTITAVIGVRHPTADGKGQLVFFFHGRTFLGWDTIRESIAIAGLSRGTGAEIRVRYVHYASDDALCCPSRGYRTVTYRWSRGRIVPDGTPPNATGSRVRLRLSARWNRCADVGPPGTDVGIYFIRALRMRCPATRHVLRRWYHDASAPDAGPRGWRCSVAASRSSERHTCARGQRRIRFTLLYE